MLFQMDSRIQERPLGLKSGRRSYNRLREPIGPVSKPDEGHRIDHSGPDGSLVSVIIPCYNQAHFLHEAVDSVLKQTYSPVEIVVVDDGSTDNTSEVAASFPGIRIILQENRGLSAARNTGLRQSSAPYLVFLDADDRLLPRALESGLLCMEKHPDCAFVAGRFRVISADGNIVGNNQNQIPQNNFYLALLHRNFIAMHGAVMYRRSVLDSVGGFKVSLKACEDYEMYLRITKLYTIAFHDTVVAEYRMHYGTMTRNCGLMLRSRQIVLRSQLSYFKGKKRYIQAYRAGIRYGQEYYGRQLTKEIRLNIENRDLVEAFKGMLVLLLYAPRIFVETFQYLPRHILRWLGIR